jgi:hypothetical protein
MIASRIPAVDFRHVENARRRTNKWKSKGQIESRGRHVEKLLRVFLDLGQMFQQRLRLYLRLMRRATVDFNFRSSAEENRHLSTLKTADREIRAARNTKPGDGCSLFYMNGDLVAGFPDFTVRRKHTPMTEGYNSCA